MKDLAPYLYPVLLAAFVLLNYVMQRIARWQKRQSAQEQETSEPAADEAQQPLDELSRRREQLRQQRDEQQRTRQQRKEQEPQEVLLARARANRPDVSGLQVQTPDASRATRVRALLADRRGLRQAFVLTTVLGPCLAQQSSADRGTRPGS